MLFHLGAGKSASDGECAKHKTIQNLLGMRVTRGSTLCQHVPTLFSAHKEAANKCKSSVKGIQNSQEVLSKFINATGFTGCLCFLHGSYVL